MTIEFSHIRNSVPIINVARHLGLDVQHNKCRCFFPNRHRRMDRTPSLSFHPRTNSFKCWVCSDVRGSVLDLIMLIRNVDILGAVEYLKSEGFIESFMNDESDIGKSRIPDRGRAGPSRQSAPITDPLSEEDRIKIYNALVEMCPGVSGKCTQYLKRRGIFKKTIEKMRLGVIDDYNGISERLKAKFSMIDLVESGLFNEKGNLRFFKHILLMPYLKHGRVFYFQARTIEQGVSPKELNPRGAIPFPYNIDAAAQGALVYLCEGIIDTLTLIENGFPAVGCPGTLNFKPEWVDYFKGKKVYSVFDADKAGRAGNRRLEALFAKKEIHFDVIDIPEGKDINELFRR